MAHDHDRPSIVHTATTVNDGKGNLSMSAAPFEPRGNTRALVLATLAFTASFYAWSMMGPLGPDLQDLLGLSEIQLAMLIAVPVLLGSLMRIPLGLLTDRYGGRKVFTALMAFTLVPLAALALWHDSFPAVILFGFFLGFAGASFAVGVPFVSRWYPRERQGMALGLYGMGMGGTVLGGLTAPRIADRWGLTAPFVVAMVLVGAMAVVFWLLARDAPVDAPDRDGGDVRVAARLPRPARRLGADLLLLPRLRRVRRDVRLPAEAADRRARPRQARRRRPGRRLRARRRHRPSDRRLAGRPDRRRHRPARLLRGDRPARRRLAPLYDEMVPLTVLALSMAAAFGLGTGAVFKLVAQDFPDRVGAVTGVVGAAGGLGGLLPAARDGAREVRHRRLPAGLRLSGPHGDRRPRGAADHGPLRPRGGGRRPGSGTVGGSSGSPRGGLPVRAPRSGYSRWSAPAQRSVPAAEALRRAQGSPRARHAEWVPLAGLAGRRLAAPLAARLDLPSGDCSAMDGWALRAADPSDPLRVVGESAAGRPFARPLAGGRLPHIDGCPAARRRRRGRAARGRSTRGRTSRRGGAPSPWAHVRRRGEDLRRGEPVLGAGVVVAAHEVAVVAAAGHAGAFVPASCPRRLPDHGGRARPARRRVPPDAVIESNLVGLVAQAEAAGAIACASAHAPDDRAATLAALSTLLGTDGGRPTSSSRWAGSPSARTTTSAGRSRLSGRAGQLRGVAMRPGHPVGVAVRGSTVVLALPGNPAAAAVCFHLLGRRPSRVREDWSHSAPLLAPVPRHRRAPRSSCAAPGGPWAAPLERQGSAQRAPSPEPGSSRGSSPAEASPAGGPVPASRMP